MVQAPNYQKLANADVSEGMSHMNVHEYLKQNTVEENRALTLLDRLPFGVCILNVTGDLNVGTIIRSAHLTGVRKVATVGRMKHDARGQVGSEKYFDVERISGLNDDGLTVNPLVFWNWISDNEFFPVFVEQGGIMLNELDWCDEISNNIPYQPCLVFGNENRGIQDDILNDSRGIVVSIPQRGAIRSFNVASAAAIVMYSLGQSIGA
jgi:tRNA G18 (ribose-2'-O)-methylase SpoU